MTRLPSSRSLCRVDSSFNTLSSSPSLEPGERRAYDAQALHRRSARVSDIRTTARGEMADATLSSSTASDQVYGHAGGHQTLPSFASSFRSEDYDRPPAGIAQADWARLARGGRNNQSRDEQEDDSSLQRGQDDSLGYEYEYEYEGRARPARGTASPASTTTATTTAALADNRRTAPISLDSSSTATEDSEAAANTFDDSADAGDRTETTTNHHLRSGVLDLSSSAAGGGASSSSRLGGDDSSSFANVYGGGGGGLRTATRDSSKGGGGAMTLREQEKVRQVWRAT